MQRTLKEVAALVRSKNAGPFWMTLDVMFDDESSYRDVVRADIINATKMAEIFNLPTDDVTVFTHDIARAIKVSFPRPVTSGSIRDNDVFGGQQYAPLLDLAFEASDA